jgi:hypothetical protein
LFNNYNWGVDCEGRAHIHKGDGVVILSMLKGYCGQIGVWILEEQDSEQ